MKLCQENSSSVSQQGSELAADIGFTIGVPVALVVYSRKQKSTLILLYLYVQLMMGLYCFYIRFVN
jgi:hypothetical protein